jgi:hypothetical protein
MSDGWFDVPGYSGDYQVNKNGRVRSFKWKKWHLLKPLKLRNGYLRLYLWHKGNGKFIAIHKIVLLTFVGKPKNNQCANHKNFKRADNRLSNLEWVTPLENIRHTKKAMRHPHGKTNGNSKLKEKDIKRIRSVYSFRKYTRNMLAKEYKVDKSCIDSVLSRRTWKHVALSRLEAKEG